MIHHSMLLLLFAALLLYEFRVFCHKSHYRFRVNAKLGQNHKNPKYFLMIWIED